ncbi:hypothetical protein TrST_g5565 [Triparma strigata]|uniref:S1 motif domain-containing protein n=1 Tax=Triparma strigata TaxID=1606541 RepID=A0A9W7EP65_9STRA|nr:hypothetical protein TrST_g5565 [Triparma strigata]
MTDLLVVPGQVLTTEQGFLRGHGCYVETFEVANSSDNGGGGGDDQVEIEIEASNMMQIDNLDDVDNDVDKPPAPPASSSADGNEPTSEGKAKPQRLVSSLLGVVHRVNKLISVHPLTPLYNASVGDLIVGRVTSVQSNRWLVSVGSNKLANLMLSSVNLPGGDQRLRNKEDSLAMRDLFKEGDLVSGEVQQINNDGNINIHARSSRYGLLENGLLTTLPPCLIKRSKSHNFLLESKTPIDVLLGCNGWCWIQRHVDLDNRGVEVITVEEIERIKKRHGTTTCDDSVKEDLTRVKNAIEILKICFRYVNKSTITVVYKKSLELGLSTDDMMRGENIIACSAGTRNAGAKIM